MLPTLSQYKKWSLPSKYTFFGLMLAVVPLIWQILVWIIAVPDYAVLAFNYGSSEMTIYGASGDSPETAVIIRNANSHEAGVKAEYYWIRRRYPGYKPKAQGLIPKPEPGSKRRESLWKDHASGVSVKAVRPSALPHRFYDIVKIRNWFRFTRSVYFDVTPFWDKGDEPRPGGITPSEATRQTIKRLEDAIDKKKRKQSTSNE